MVQSKGGMVYDFSVVGFAIGASSAQINLWINNDLSWSKIMISYMITSRKDLFLGSFPVFTMFIVDASDRSTTVSFYKQSQ